MSRDSDLDIIWGNLQTLATRMTWASSDLSNAQAHWDVGEDHEAIYDILYALYDIRYGVDIFAYKYSPFYPDTALHHFLSEHTIATAEVTMSDVLSAMLTADPDEIQQFVGITEAYMQSIWDRPYNKEVFAALGRGFMTWE